MMMVLWHLSVLACEHLSWPQKSSEQSPGGPWGHWQEPHAAVPSSSCGLNDNVQHAVEPTATPYAGVWAVAHCCMQLCTGPSAMPGCGHVT